MTTFRLLSRKFFDGDKIHHNKVMERPEPEHGRLC